MVKRGNTNGGHKENINQIMRKKKFKGQLNPVFYVIWLVTLFLDAPRRYWNIVFNKIPAFLGFKRQT